MHELCITLEALGFTCDVTKFCHIWAVHLTIFIFIFYFDYDLEENVTKYVTNLLICCGSRGFTILILSHFCHM